MDAVWFLWSMYAYVYAIYFRVYRCFPSRFGELNWAPAPRRPRNARRGSVFPYFFYELTSRSSGAQSNLLDVHPVASVFHRYQVNYSRATRLHLFRYIRERKDLYISGNFAMKKWLQYQLLVGRKLEHWRQVAECFLLCQAAIPVAAILGATPFPLSIVTCERLHGCLSCRFKGWESGSGSFMSRLVKKRLIRNCKGLAFCL
jgi:hypothetical protein